jgi:hypothetical protein
MVDYLKVGNFLGSENRWLNLGIGS